ncbi:hypothetical protein CesoFtcFv8_020261 [Champsocephalus esox]|uniref:Uncharacterized protein n=2 Tax=Champsocephalus TaxID=52236 RepID=A0AAN8CW58_CHAGU|nr:hypothetical protein CesoFtcFv8_020261 [Champsocephalus esox]KAK5911570.1 hypothetical protein CgunFtcFv8_005732 [Champsocephalus gunnari]
MGRCDRRGAWEQEIAPNSNLLVPCSEKAPSRALNLGVSALGEVDRGLRTAAPSTSCSDGKLFWGQPLKELRSRPIRERLRVYSGL